MKKKAIIVDIDGTIADNTHRQHFLSGNNKQWDNFFNACYRDKVYEDTVSLIKLLINKDIEIFFVTGRKEKYRNQTESWLDTYTKLFPLKNSHLIMRENEDWSKDYLYKYNIVNMLKEDYDIFAIFEDNTDCINMYREQGFTCYQCRPQSY